MEKIPLKQLIEEDKVWYCPIAFTQLYSDMGGGWASCCFGKVSTENTVHNTTIKEWNNSEYMNSIRRDMINPDTDFKAVDDKCWRCRYDEKTYGKSRRITSTAIYRNNPELWQRIINAAEMFDQTGEHVIDTRIFELQPKIWGNKCNLDCYMCFPSNSSTREKMLNENLTSIDGIFESARGSDYIERVKVDQIKSNNFIEQAREIAPYIKNLKIIGGEPLIMKKQYELLDMLIETGDSKHICLKYQTNGSELKAGKHRFIDYIPHFKEVVTAISVDGIGAVNDITRRRSKFEKLKANWELIDKFPNTLVTWNGTVTFLTMMRFYEVFDYAKEHEIEMNYAFSLFPKMLKANNLPQEIKDGLYEKYKDHPDFIKCLDLPQEIDFNMRELVAYLKENDEYYETNTLDVFPEMKPYWYD